ncbi:hypothetical protein ACIQGZ_13915 [Streptomyces sp. NPDC092296]|uniref:hypothetical protein n=1 Tax=Streptomyces sp. NPDC092296 TaxID=3366012 RepID=UPI0037FC84A3
MDQPAPTPDTTVPPPAGAPLPPPPAGRSGAPLPPPAGEFGAPIPPPTGEFGGPVPPPPSPYLQAPIAPAPPATASRAALGALAGVVAALVAAALYGGLIRVTEREFSYAALAVGALVGAALGKVGGRSQTLPVLGVPLALLGVFLGQLFGIALLAQHELGISVSTLMLDHTGTLYDAWKEQLGVMDVLFFAVAGYMGFALAKRSGAHG